MRNKPLITVGRIVVGIGAVGPFVGSALALLGILNEAFGLGWVANNSVAIYGGAGIIVFGFMLTVFGTLLTDLD